MKKILFLFFVLIFGGCVKNSAIKHNYKFKKRIKVYEPIQRQENKEEKYEKEMLNNFKLKIENLGNSPIKINKMELEKVVNIVIDKQRKLMWQDDYFVVKNKMSFKKAKEYCKNLRLNGYKDWRLPTIEELISIMPYSPYESNRFWFRGSIYFWSSSKCLYNCCHQKYNIFIINNRTGRVSYAPENKFGYVRCVRNIKEGDK